MAFMNSNIMPAAPFIRKTGPGSSKTIVAQPLLAVQINLVSALQERSLNKTEMRSQEWLCDGECDHPRRDGVRI